MTVANMLSRLGERLGVDSLVYNPLIFLYYHEHALASAPVVVDTFEDVFPDARTFVDVGAGSGAFAAELIRRGRSVLAFEHSRIGRFIARLQGVDAKPFDLKKESSGWTARGHFDVSYCFEVAEHLPQELGERLVRFVADAGATVVFTAAQPGQGGTGHLNEQPPDYWATRFNRHGLQRDTSIEARVREGFARARSPWLAPNVLVFTRPGRDAPVSRARRPGD
jgi:SAM-dependent methyltransferase